MGLNISNISYLLFRLAPFIIVSFFVLQSFLMWDLKGLVYLCGLLLATVVTLFCNVLFKKDDIDTERNPRCNIITLGENGNYISNIPLNLMVYSFSFGYLLIFILNLANLKNSTKGVLQSKQIKQTTINMALRQNIPILIFFPLLIIVEVFWILNNSCSEFLNSVAGVIIGSGCGLIWAVIITSLNVPQLQYITSKNTDVCTRPTKTLYRCKPKT